MIFDTKKSLSLVFLKYLITYEKKQETIFPKYFQHTTQMLIVFIYNN